MVITEEKARERASSMRPQFMETSGPKRVKKWEERAANRQKVNNILGTYHKNTFKHNLPADLGLSCPPSMYICQNLMYPS